MILARELSEIQNSYLGERNSGGTRMSNQISTRNPDGYEHLGAKGPKAIHSEVKPSPRDEGKFNR